MKGSVFRLAIGLVGLCFLTSACGDTRSEAELVADATQKMSQNQYRSAVIDLRNALRANPNNREARVALAKSLIEMDDGVAAEKEISRAIELGATPDEYAMTLAQALMARNGFAELVAEIDPSAVSDVALASELSAVRGRAMLAMGSEGPADQIFKDVLAAGESVEAQRIALLGKASMALKDSDNAAAERFARKSLEIAPDSAESYLTLGQILMLEGKFEEANSLLAEEKSSGFKMSRMERFRLEGDRSRTLLGMGKIDEAADAAEAMAAIAPEHPMSSFLRGRIELQRGNLDRALEHLQTLGADYPNFAPGQALLGAVSMQRGETEQAEEYLRKALSLDPNNAMARQMFAELQIRTSRPSDAAELLRNGLDTENADPQTLAMLGKAEMMSGDQDLAIDYLRRSIAKDPDNAQVKLSLVSALVAQGKSAEAVELIESIPDDAMPEGKKSLLLIVAQLDRENPGPSKAKLDQLMAQAGDDVTLRSLAGSVYISIGELEKARNQFNRVLQITPDDLGAKLSILRLDSVANDYSESKRLFSAAREQNEDDVVPLIALARIAGREGNKQRMLELTREAHAVDETALYPNITLGGEALNRNDINAAANYAQLALANNANSAIALAFTGMVQVRAGQFSDAVRNLREAAEIAPESRSILYELGRAQLGAEQLAQARDSFAKAYELDNSHLPSLRALAILEVRANNDARADELLLEARKTVGPGPVLDQLTGDVRAAQENLPAALASFESAQAAAPSWGLAAKIYSARRQSGVANPEQSLIDWLEENPDHRQGRTLLAQAYQSMGNAGAAIAQYEILIDQDPESALALNNLAWLYFESGDAGKRARALDMAGKATALAPDSPAIADTYGWIQFKSGKVDDGVQTLRKALSLTSPKRSPEIAYHLAVALHENGATNEARETLLQALATTRPFGSRDNAQRLYDSL